MHRKMHFKTRGGVIGVGGSAATEETGGGGVEDIQGGAAEKVHAGAIKVEAYDGPFQYVVESVRSNAAVLQCSQ